MLIGPRAENHVDRIQEEFCSWGIISSPRDRVQPRIALSSGEAELYVGIRGISETVGFVHMMRDFKTNDWGRIAHRVDARACRAIMLRRGCGGLKHITAKALWVQEAVRECSIEIERISRDEMHAHILASPSSAEVLKKHLTELNAFRNLAEEAAGVPS